MSEGVSIILLMFNEELNIAITVRNILDFVKTTRLKAEIIIVNDGSTDSTGKVADNLAKSSQNLRVIHHSRNLGYGQALRSGIVASRHDLVFFTDADRQFDIRSLSDMLLIINTVPNVDIIIGYRLKRQDPLLRRFLSWGFNTIVGFIFDLNVKDIDCAFKLFRKKIFFDIEIESKYFFVNSEILAKARYFGFRIAEIGVPHFPRLAGRSTVSLKYIPLTLRELWRIWRSLHKLRRREKL